MVPATDYINYILQFASQGAALHDPIVGPYYFKNGAVPTEVLVFSNVKQNSVTPQSGYWIMITETGGIDNNLYTHPNIQLVNDQTAYGLAQPSVLLANIPFANLGVMVNAYGNFIPAGLSGFFA